MTHVGLALHDPEAFAASWNSGEIQYRWWVWGSLWATAVLGTTTYGMTMGILVEDAGDILYKGMACTVAAGLAWAIPLPALYPQQPVGLAALGQQHSASGTGDG